MSKKNVTSSNILCWKILCALDFTQRERETHIYEFLDRKSIMLLKPSKEI